MKRVQTERKVTNIDSFDSFVCYRCEKDKNFRDLFFVRALGENDSYLENVKKMDSELSSKMEAGELRYMRIYEFIQLCKAEDVSYYKKSFEKISAGDINLKNVRVSIGLNQTLKSAIDVAGEKYRKTGKGMSDTMINNYKIKLLFWFDNLVGSYIDDWEQQDCIKVVASDIQKNQEYLFLYFLSLLGIEVMILENKKDIDITDEIKSLSSAFQLGAYGNNTIPEYRTNENKQSGSDDINVIVKHEYTENITGKSNEKIVITMPRRNKASRNTSADNGIIPNDNKPNIIINSDSIRKNKTHTVVNERREKTYEELASLASSIVMIVVHDKLGEPVGGGSGIMIGSSGYILTNFHVAASGYSYTVKIEDDDNAYHTDSLIKYNNRLDLAVIRINKKLHTLPIYDGRNKLVRGQKVVAIGSPLGLFNSVSDGIISGFRNIDDVDMIQFTAPISHGSSGGAVLNMYGEVIGISTGGFDDGQNINLAVGYESIRAFASPFIDK